VNSTSQK
jgi:hypothetical protein